MYILNVYTKEGDAMTHAKVFQSGNSQAVRLPKAFRFHSSEVEIFRRGDEVVLREKPQSLVDAFDQLSNLPSGDWDDARDERAPEDRKGL